jgi:hypothetical protein
LTAWCIQSAEGRRPRGRPVVLAVTVLRRRRPTTEPVAEERVAVEVG